MTTHQDNDQDDFSNVTWSDHVHEQTARSAAVAAAEGPGRTMEEAGTSSAQAMGREKLECTVGSPIKENDGTKDAFVSYLVTTHVCEPKGLRVNLCLSVSPCPSFFTPPWWPSQGDTKQLLKI